MILLIIILEKQGKIKLMIYAIDIGICYMDGKEKIIKIINLKNMIKLYNIGFTQKTAESFFEILKENKINCLVDVRLNPNGQLSRFAFEKDLPFFLDKLVDGCKYVHRVDLAPSKELLKKVREKDSPMNQNYKLFEKEFKEQLERESKIENFVEQFNSYKNIALLCSEPTTEKCHRRLVIEMLVDKFSDEVEFVKDL